jgi:thiamine pyrophosphokinase
VVKVEGGPHVVVVANGELSGTGELLPIVDQADVLIAADGGANWLAAHGRTPHVLIGDLDSVSSAMVEHLGGSGCRVVRHLPDKDETDTELALLEAVAIGARRITILGALGRRIDHELANILLLNMPQLAGVETVIATGSSHLFAVRGAGVVSGEIGDIVSLVPLGGSAEGISTEGLEYPLRNETLYVGPARGVSNVLSEPVARVTVRRGSLLVVHTPRRHVEERDRRERSRTR